MNKVHPISNKKSNKRFIICCRTGIICILIIIIMLKPYLTIKCIAFMPININNILFFMIFNNFNYMF